MKPGEQIGDIWSDYGPYITFVAIGAAVGGVGGYVFGSQAGAEPRADTTTLDEHLATVTDKIDDEKQAVQDLRPARPDTDGAIRTLDDLMAQQRGQISALQAQKKDIVAAQPGHDGPYGWVGAGIGALAAAAVMTNAVRKWRYIQTHPTPTRRARASLF